MKNEKDPKKTRPIKRKIHLVREARIGDTIQPWKIPGPEHPSDFEIKNLPGPPLNLFHKLSNLKFHPKVASRRSVSFCVRWAHRLPRGSFRANDAKCRNFDVDVVDVDEEMTLTIDDVTRATSVDVASEAYVTTNDGRTKRAKLVAVQPILDIFWLNLNQKDIFRINLKLILCVDLYVSSTYKYT